MSSLAQYFSQQLGIWIIIVSVNYHKNPLAEYSIKNLSMESIKHISGLSYNLDKFLGLALLIYNSYSSPVWRDYVLVNVT